LTPEEDVILSKLARLIWQDRWNNKVITEMIALKIMNIFDIRLKKKEAS
jgi:hypothetical protein